MIYGNIDSRRNLSFFRNKKLIIPVGLIIIVISAGFFIKNVILANKGNNVLGDSRISIPVAKSKQDINRNFSFPLKNKKGEEVSRIDYTILDASLLNQIVSQGKNYTTVKGRTILILNIKITNNHNKSIEISSRDYVRLTVNGSTELLAADIHNDPVLIQATSTKYTRLGFPIYETDKNLKLLVGEIGGTKEEVAISF